MQIFVAALICWFQTTAPSMAQLPAQQGPTVYTNQIPNGILIAIISIVFSAIVGGGGVAWWFRSGTNMKLAEVNATSALAKADALTTQAMALSVTSGQHEALIQEIRTRMSKLDKIDEMATTVAFMRDATSNIVNHMVPRAEVERKWDADDAKFIRIEAQIDDLRETQKA